LPGFRPLYQAGAARVGLDVAAQRQEVIVGLDAEMLVPPLIKVTASDGIVVLMMAADVREGKPLHQALKFAGRARAEDQVPVVAHQTPAQQVDAMSPQRLDEDVGRLNGTGPII
jgi:hypothetical protein